MCESTVQRSSFYSSTFFLYILCFFFIVVFFFVSSCFCFLFVFSVLDFFFFFEGYVEQYFAYETIKMKKTEKGPRGGRRDGYVRGIIVR